MNFVKFLTSASEGWKVDLIVYEFSQEPTVSFLHTIAFVSYKSWAEL